MSLHRARFDDLDASTLYALLKLRVDVFVVEQGCAYGELDGRDTEPGTWHLWVDDDAGAPLAYLRLLAEPDGGSRIGRLATAAAARGSGLAGRLVTAALEGAPRPVTLAAQSPLEAFYAGFGFARTGDEFDDDGILHVPMRLD